MTDIQIMIKTLDEIEPGWRDRYPDVDLDDFHQVHEVLKAVVNSRPRPKPKYGPKYHSFVCPPCVRLFRPGEIEI